jgi:N-hydroxyarylamine O-acetyltransferase
VDWRQLLVRIGAPFAEPSLQTLHAFQRRALATLPFENMDIHLGRTIRLDSGALHEKIGLEGRGGVCNELNPYFLSCLRCLGYEAYRMEARVELGENYERSRRELESRAYPRIRGRVRPS